MTKSLMEGKFTYGSAIGEDVKGGANLASWVSKSSGTFAESYRKLRGTAPTSSRGGGAPQGG